jgi:hypothetical protein
MSDGKTKTRKPKHLADLDSKNSGLRTAETLKQDLKRTGANRARASASSNDSSGNAAKRFTFRMIRCAEAGAGQGIGRLQNPQ